MTIGELKKRIEKFPDEAEIFYNAGKFTYCPLQVVVMFTEQDKHEERAKVFFDSYEPF